jgi:1,4-dihydroxy-2-naphthoate octaprenyltransferase
MSPARRLPKSRGPRVGGEPTALESTEPKEPKESEEQTDQAEQVHPAEPGQAAPGPDEASAAPGDSPVPSGDAALTRPPEGSAEAATENPVAEAATVAELSEPDNAPGPPPPTVAESLAKLASFSHAVLSWVAEDGYPVNVDVEIEVKPDPGIVRFREPTGFKLPSGARVALTGSHIRPLPEGGFDERSHVTIWGVAAARPRGRFVATVGRAWAWDERDLPLPAAYERNLPKARRYFEALSAARGVPVRPRLSPALLLFRATRAPFLSATFAPVLLGFAVAARAGFFDVATALITLVAASAVHLGLNVANDIFDTLQGADDANTTPTKFSGGSRVLQNALVSIREMSLLAAGCYAVAAVLGLVLLLLRGSPALVAIFAIGLFISLAYTAPPFKLVYRGVGEISTAIGFGPVMLLGAFTVQSRGTITLEALVVSIPVALLVALILYVNEIPDRTSDATVGKRTLPVRWSKQAVIRGFDAAAAANFLVVVGGVAVGILPIPALLTLLAIPLAIRIHRGLVSFYDNPYALMATMAANIQLHMTVGLLLLVGYLATIADQTLLARRPFLW